MQTDFNLNTIKNSFKEDLLAAFSVSLVALPLALGVAIASGVSPMAGIWSCIVGGLVATWFRGGYVSINGPAAGLIVVILAGMESMQDDTWASGFKYVLAATVITGGIQMLLGLLRMGKYADMAPTSVINGMLAAIGVIIASKQMHYAFGVEAAAKTTLGGIMEIPTNFIQQNPFVTIIAIVSLAILILHPRIKSKLVHTIPAPIWVLVFSIPLVFIFNFFEDHELSIFSHSYMVGPDFLVDVPNNPLDSLAQPDFSKIGYLDFWLLVATLSIIASIQTLVVAKAVDKLDKEERQTNLDRDLFGVGVGNLVCGFIGGLPLIAVIVRSSVNINNGAKTRWSNLYHGLIVLAFVFLLPSLIQMIPLAALAGLLIFTGYKLASPKVFRDSMRKGWEQVIILIVTLFVTLSEGLLTGIGMGMLVTFIIQWLQSGMTIIEFFISILKPRIITKSGADPQDVFLRVGGILNFLNILGLKKSLRKVAADKHLVLDLSRCNIVDYTVLEYLHDQAEKYDLQTDNFDIIGLDVHNRSSRHPNALHVLKAKRPPRLTKRQKELKEIADELNANFFSETNYDVTRFRKFIYFKSRPVEFKINSTKGKYANCNTAFEFCDLIFDEGALSATEEYHSSILVLQLSQEIPSFVLEREGLLDKIGIRLHLQANLDFVEFKHFSDRFLLKGDDENAVRAFFSPELIQYLDEHESYHIESMGRAVLIFKAMRFSSPKEIRKMHDFAKFLSELLTLKTV